jgi:hypothetical protein
MKRLIISALALAALVAGSSAASAAGTKTVSGQLTGTAEWAPQDFHATSWTIHGTYTSDGLGSGTYAGTLTTNHVVLDASVEDPPGCFETNFIPCNSSPRFDVSGSITFTSHGASFTGTVAPGSWVTESDSVHAISYSFSLQLDVGGGTRRFKNIVGSLSLSYTSGLMTGIGCGTDCGKVFDGGTLTGTIEH